jgi:hypothetical protein
MMLGQSHSIFSQNIIYKLYNNNYSFNVNKNGIPNNYLLFITVLTIEYFVIQSYNLKSIQTDLVKKYDNDDKLNFKELKIEDYSNS